MIMMSSFLFLFNETATTEIYTLSLHDALPIFDEGVQVRRRRVLGRRHLRTLSNARDRVGGRAVGVPARCAATGGGAAWLPDRKSTRLNSRHANISYAVFCLKKHRTSF